MPKPAARVTDLTQHGGVIMPPCALKTMIEMLPAARLTDMHTCPMVTVLVPHVGGPIIMAAPTVFIEFLPAARVMDQLVCVGPPDMIQMGAMKTFIGEGGGGGGGAMATISPPAPPAAGGSSGAGSPSAAGSPSMPGMPASSPGAPPDGGPGAPADKATTEGDPVDVATGRVFTLVEDFTTQGNPCFTFARFYSTSQARENSEFGYGWTHSLDHRLQVAKDFITYRDAQGRKVLFLPLRPDQEFILHLDENITLRRLEGRYRVELPDGRRLHFQSITESITEGTTARVERIDSANGGSCRLHYENGLLSRVTDALGHEYLFESPDGKRIQAITFRSQDGKLTAPIARFAYDAAGNLTFSADALGYSLRYQYDPEHRLVLRTDKSGHDFTFQYDHLGRCLRSFGPEHLFDQTFFYSPNTPQTIVRNTRGGAATYSFNALGMVTQVANAQGAHRQFEYQGMNLVKHTDTAGRATEYLYDTHGNLLATQKPGGAVSTTQIFSDGSRLSQDAEGNTLVVHQKDGETHLHWDGDDTPLAAIAAGPGPRRLTVRDPHDHATILTYDQADRVVSIRLPLGQTYRFNYDVRGNRTAVVDPIGVSVQFGRDALGRVTQIIREGAGAFRFDYDGDGRLSHYVDGNGYATQFEHRQFERLTGITYPTGHSVRYEYDEFNRLRKLIDGRGGATLYDYDALGQVQRVLYPDGRSEFWTFDPAGQLRRRLDRGGMGVDYDYDAQGNLVLLRYLDGTAMTFAHDKNGRLRAANNADCEATFTYDKLGRLIEESQNGATVAYTYDAAGLLTQIVLPDGTEVLYGYDANSRLERVTYGSCQPHTFAYALSGPLEEQRFPNKISARTQHSRPGLPVQTTLGLIGSNRLIAQTAYRYDGNDALIEINDSQLGSTIYRYDPAGRLLTAQYGSATGETFQYDAAGNITAWDSAGGAAHDARLPVSRSLAYNAANQLEGGGGLRCHHDTRGQIVRVDEDSRSGTRTIQFNYNGQGLLTSAVLPDGSQVEYAYDALARRISKKQSKKIFDKQLFDKQEAVETYYAWSGNQLIGEITFGPNAQETRRTYLYRPGTYLLLAVIIDEEYYCIHTDHRDAPVRVTDSRGEVVWLADYNAWGNALLRIERIELNLRLPGQYYDVETGLHYNRTRYYHPQWGRYLTPDPAGYAGGLNLYVYADNDPVNRVDPMGMWPDRDGSSGTVGSSVANSTRDTVAKTGNTAPPPPVTPAANTPTATTTTPAQNTVGNAVTPTPDAPPPGPPAGAAACGAPSDASRVADAVNAAATSAVTGAKTGGAPVCPPPSPPKGDPGTQPVQAPTAPASGAAQKKYAIWDLRWEPKKGYCGDKVKLLGSTDAPDGTTVNLDLKAKQGSSPNLSGFTAQASGGKIQQDWEIKDVSFASGNTFLTTVDVAAQSTDANLPSNEAVLTVAALLNASEQDFNSERKWGDKGQFVMRPSFKQKIDKFKNSVQATSNIMQGWGGTYVNMNPPDTAKPIGAGNMGLTGRAGGCPWDGYRWARSTSGLSMQPDQYYDGKDWVAFPAWFALDASKYFGTAFYKDSSGKFVCYQGGEWPESFADYDFNAAVYSDVRAQWISNTHDKWTDQFLIRRKDCHSQSNTRCCRYAVEVTLTINIVTQYDKSVTLVCPGNQRSNALVYFMGDKRIEVAAHETGHHMDLPDEYAGGAVDLSVPDGDGLASGIDADSIMGQSMTKVKKRHYRPFAAMTKMLIKAAFGKDYEYEVVDK